MWTGLGANSNWTTAANWSGAVPTNPGDVAQFTGTYTAAQSVVTINQNITVGEIDFGTTSNITINGSGTNLLTLDNTSAGANAILNVGASPYTNSGVDVINAPVVNNPATPLTATVSGGTLQLTNTSTGATANVIGNTATFTVNTGGTLRESALGTGSLTTANLVDTGALSGAALNLNGGTLVIDPTASTAATGLASDFITTTGSQINANDYLATPAISNTPTFQTARRACRLPRA